MKKCTNVSLASIYAADEGAGKRNCNPLSGYDNSDEPRQKIGGGDGDG